MQDTKQDPAQKTDSQRLAGAVVIAAFVLTLGLMFHALVIALAITK